LLIILSVTDYCCSCWPVVEIPAISGCRNLALLQRNGAFISVYIYSFSQKDEKSFDFRGPIEDKLMTDSLMLFHTTRRKSYRRNYSPVLLNRRASRGFRITARYGQNCYSKMLYKARPKGSALACNLQPVIEYLSSRLTYYTPPPPLSSFRLSFVSFSSRCLACPSACHCRCHSNSPPAPSGCHRTDLLACACGCCLHRLGQPCSGCARCVCARCACCVRSFVGFLSLLLHRLSYRRGRPLGSGCRWLCEKRRKVGRSDVEG